MAFFAIEAVLIVLCIITANVMVKKRIWFTKRLVIVKESDGEVEKLKAIAENLLSKEVTDPSLEGLTINVHIKDGKIAETEVKSAKTKVLSSKKDGTRSFNQAWSPKGAVAITAFTIWGVALWLHILITMAYQIYALQQMLL